MRWSLAEIEALRHAYGDGTRLACDIDLPGLAIRLGRNKANVCRKARDLGLTDQRRKMTPAETHYVNGAGKRKHETPEERAAAGSVLRKQWFASNPHPRGMLGKKHRPEVLQQMSALSAKRWRDITEEQLAERSLKTAKTRAVNMAAGAYVNERKGTTWKAGWREIGRHRKYFRSRWEANYARYLQFLQERGQIDDWEHEPETFWFEGIKRGACSYLPDFKVVEGGVVTYHEVKGWMDDRSRTKIRRMAKYHPRVKLLVIVEKDYREIARKLGGVIPGWEAGNRGVGS